MERFGDMFPGNPQDLDELLEQMAARMAAAAGHVQLDVARAAGPAPGRWPSRCSRTWTCAGRWTGSAGNLQQAFPDAGWDAALPVQRRRPDGLGGGRPTPPAGSRDLDDLEGYLRSANSPARWPRWTSTRCAAASARTPPAPSTGWPRWPSS